MQKADVKVLPGAEGFRHPLTGTVSHTPQEWQNRPWREKLMEHAAGLLGSQL